MRLMVASVTSANSAVSPPTFFPCAQHALPRHSQQRTASSVPCSLASHVRPTHTAQFSAKVQPALIFFHSLGMLHSHTGGRGKILVLLVLRLKAR
jgi:hypothetical protein